MLKVPVPNKNKKTLYTKKNILIQFNYTKYDKVSVQVLITKKTLLLQGFCYKT